jgi:E3 ubiquitin-protein ligase RNF13/E3 ubiquitin-protein ligase RNF167
VQRGKCEFVKKVREAQRLGARAVVVGGENPDTSGFPDTLVNMYSPGAFSAIFERMRHLTPCPHRGFL